MQLFLRLLWLGPLVVFLVVCGALAVAWAVSRTLGSTYDFSTVCAIGAVVGGLVMSAYIWKVRAEEAVRY